MNLNIKQFLLFAVAVMTVGSVYANHITTSDKNSTSESLSSAKEHRGTNTVVTLETMIKDLPVTNGEISVLFAYTTRAAIQAGGPGELKKNVDNGMKLLNEALRNSNIGYNAVIIPRFVEVTSEDQPKNSTEVYSLLNELRKTDGKFSAVHKFRKELRGDIVCLIFSGKKMGVADSFNGAIRAGQFMVCHAVTFGGSWVFPHEFGHNLGAQHDPTKNGNGGISPYNWKYGNNTYRTVSNNGGVAIPYFSENKTVQFELEGQLRTIKLGDRNYDNVKIMKQVAPLAAAMGDNLPSVTVSGNAYRATLVNPANAPIPAGSKQVTEVTNMRIDGGILYISYNSESGGRFKLIELKDGKGNLTNMGRYNPSLRADKTVREIDAQFQKDDYIKLQIDNDYFVEYNNGRFIKSGGTSSTITNSGSNNYGNTSTTKQMDIDGGSTTTTTIITTKPPKKINKPSLNSGRNTLYSGETLGTNKRLYAANGAYYVAMQEDGHLCIYTSKDIYQWCSGKHGFNNAKLILQTDGNLVVYDGGNQPKWATDTTGYFDQKFNDRSNMPTKLVIENNGELNLYNSAGNVVWSNK